MGCKVQGLGFQGKVQALRFSVFGLGLRVKNQRSRVYDPGFRASCSGFGFCCLGFRFYDLYPNPGWGVLLMMMIIIWLIVSGD